MNLNKSLLTLTGICVTAILGCSSSPHKAEQVDTSIEKTQNVGGGEQIGVKDGKMVVQQKVLMGEELRKLQTDVYEMEDRIYGNRKYGSKGKYGLLKECRMELADKSNGGDGKMKWTEPISRVTDSETEFKIGLDEKDQLVGVSEEFLKDRIARFSKYKGILQGREDEISEKLDICQTDLKSQKAEYEKTKATK